MHIGLDIIKPDAGSSIRLLLSKEINENIWTYHYHNQIELTYVASRYSALHIGNNMQIYTEDQLILIGPGVPHSNFDFARSKQQQLSLHIDELALSFDSQKIPEMAALNQLLKSSKQGIAFTGYTKDEGDKNGQKTCFGTTL